MDVLDKLIPHDHRPPQGLVDVLLPENWIKGNPDKVVKEPAPAEAGRSHASNEAICSMNTGGWSHTAPYHAMRI